jgi:hypothetical protein
MPSLTSSATNPTVDHSGSGRGRDRGNVGVDAGERHALVAGIDGATLGLSRSTIGRIWRTFELAPHRVEEGFKFSTDPLFIEKVYDVVGLYLNPPETAVVLCVDEKSQVQALDRSQPVLPMMPGMPEKRSHDYFRHGTTSLFAAFNIADGTVISAIHRRHRTVEFKKFLIKIDKEVPAGRASPLPRALHPDRLVLDQPGRTLVRLPHHPAPATRRAQEHPGPRTRHQELGQDLERRPETLYLDQNRRTNP